MTRIVRLGPAIAIAAITLLAIAVGTVEPIVVILAAAGTVVSLLALVLTIYQRRRLEAALERVRAIEPVVAPEPAPLPNRDTAAIADEIRELGFAITGATDTALEATPQRTWILVEPSGEMWVEIGYSLRPMSFFLSETGGGRFVETCYPFGGPIDDPRLLSQVVTKSAAAALVQHRAAVAAGGGPRRTVTSLDDYLATEAEHRRRTGGMRIAANLARVIRPAVRDWAIGLVVEAVALAALLVSFSSGG